MFVWVCELQTSKPEHGCKINRIAFWLANSYTGGARYDISDGQESYIKFREKINVFKFDIFSVAKINVLRWHFFSGIL